MNYCGIDLACRASAVCVIDEAGVIGHECEVTTDALGFRRALAGLQAVRCVLEASPLAETVAAQLEALGHEVVVVDPRRAKALVSTKRKTDRLDARALAQMARTGWLTEVHRKSARSRLLRTQLKARQGLVQTANACTARIRGLLRAHGIQVGKVSAGQFSGRVRALLECRAPALAPVIEPLLTVWHEARAGTAQLTKTLRQQVRSEPVCRQLMSAPGVGPLVAAAYVATLDAPERFARGEQVGAYAGLVPSVRQSGERDSHGPITKEGDALLRWLLVEAAHALLTRTRKSCALKRWGLKLMRAKGMARAKVAVARKLAALLHRMWLTGSPFDWQRG